MAEKNERLAYIDEYNKKLKNKLKEY